MFSVVRQGYVIFPHTTYNYILYLQGGSPSIRHFIFLILIMSTYIYYSSYDFCTYSTITYHTFLIIPYGHFNTNILWIRFIF